MKVIKKDGRIQEFDKEKIYGSLNNAVVGMDEEKFNESDIRVLVSDIVNKINSIRKDNDSTSSYEIRGIIADALIEDGFSDVLDIYLNN
ncbi:ATP cone domain-containing protein [Clostridium sp. DSM 8431]|uniref:ATP cone domain-containing protein n=1 Tax=Clostridium sp. DSM 8431 TaxID=1761781 RepID=UPI0008E12967|nr:ATP cone domain-containing protein [Clostridium sp. DSM 8431]SFU70818.1 ATP cone domain-containing protein [Clostridium sp. DSM 8431]